MMLVLQVTYEAIEEMKKSKEVIDWDTIRKEEKRVKHDVMAHNFAFGKVILLTCCLSSELSKDQRTVRLIFFA